MSRILVQKLGNLFWGVIKRLHWITGGRGGGLGGPKKDYATCDIITYIKL